MFSLPGPGQEWPILVLAVADGQGGHASGRLASAVAIDTFGESLGKAISTVAFESWTWQSQATDAIEFAVQRANAEVRALAAERGEGREPATGLTALVLLANWIAVVHVGRGRAWRLRKADLEQLTADRSSPTVLGMSPQVLPDVRFLRVESGEVLAVASDGLYRHVDGDELGRWLTSRDGVMEILVDLLGAVADRGGEDDVSLCLCRVRRLPDVLLPDPAPRPDRTIVTPELPHFPVAPTPRWRPGQWVFALMTLAVAVGAIGGGLGWWGEAQKPVDPLASGWVATARPEPVPAVPESVVATATADSVAPPRAAGATRAAPAEVVPDPAVPAAPLATLDADSARVADSTRRARRDSVRAERQRQDSVEAAAVAARDAEQQRYRDSVASAMEVLRREREAADQRARAESTARSESARQAAARQRAEQEARDRELVHITAGRAAFGTWLGDIDRQSSAGNRASPAIASGPASYQGFVAKNKPVIEGARLTTMEVNDSTGVAIAEWTMKWRTDFGTGSERRVRARAEAARTGETWRVKGWRILEGAP